MERNQEQAVPGEWNPDQRAARIRYGSETEGSSVNERLVEQFVDPEKKAEPTFNLYYFSKDFSYLTGDTSARKADVSERTILFMSGGPGEVNRPGSGNFGDLEGYRTVYFHLRGAGFSQIPGSNSFDRFLRTRYAVEDIEKIREDLGIEKWRAIIAHSYGTVLAQQYAHKYGTERVEKLVLSAPLSRHEKTTETLQFTSLRRIYDAENFDFLGKLFSPDRSKDIKDYLTDKAMEAFQKAENEFGTVQSLIETYGRFGFDIRSLANMRLGYSIAFFKALRRLRLTGWLPHDEDLAKGATENVDTVQQLAGLLVAYEILTRDASGYDTSQIRNYLESLLQRGSNVNSTNKVLADIENAKTYFKGIGANTARAYYVVSIYDGINERFLREFEVKKDIPTAIQGLGGKQYGANAALKNIGIENDPIERWDPKKFSHSVPTLVLKAEADPVTESGQAEYVSEHGLTGERVLLKFPGIGHSMSLPRLASNVNSRDYLLEQFISSDFENLRSNVLPKVREAFENLLKRPSHQRYIGLKVCGQYTSRQSKPEEW